MSKKVVAVIAGPYQFLQVLWYYSQHPNYEYVAVIKPYGANIEIANKNQKDIYDLAIKTGVFSQVILAKAEIINCLPFNKKIRMAVKLFCVWLFGLKHRYSLKVVNECLNDIPYDVCIVDSEMSIFSGAFIELSDDKETIILSEGLSDIQNRKKYPAFTLKEIFGYMLAKMSYADPCLLFGLNKMKYCEKFTALPSLINNADRFAKVSSVFNVNDNNNINLYQSITSTIYDFSEMDKIKNCDVILFTSSFLDYSEDTNFLDTLHTWLYKNYGNKRILIKKHPQDIFYNYSWNDLDIRILESNVPAELIIKEIVDKEIILEFISTFILTLITNSCNFKVIEFSELEKCKNYKDIFLQLKEKLCIESSNIVKV